MKVYFSRHAAKRIKEPRQRGIRRRDVFQECYKARRLIDKTPLYEKIYLKDLTALSGRNFKMVIVNQLEGLKVITVIGISGGRRRNGNHRRRIENKGFTGDQ